MIRRADCEQEIVFVIAGNIIAAGQPASPCLWVNEAEELDVREDLF